MSKGKSGSRERRAFNRFNIKHQSIEVELIIDDYKRLPGLSIVNNISLGGMNILIKEKIPQNSKIKFHIGKSKTIFNGTVLWVKEGDGETYPYNAGISFNFPFKEVAEDQKKELIAFVLKMLKKMPKEQLIDRLMELFIERRRIFQAAQERIEEAEAAIKASRSKTEESLDRAYAIVDNCMSGVLYLDDTFNIIYSNLVSEDLLGYDSDEMKEMNLRNILSENTEKMAKRYCKQENTNIYNGTIIGKYDKNLEVKWRILSHTVNEKQTICFMFLEK